MKLNLIHAKNFIDNDLLEKIECHIESKKPQSRTFKEEFFHLSDSKKIIFILSDLIEDNAEKLFTNFASFILFEKDFFLKDLKIFSAFIGSKNVSIRDILPDDNLQDKLSYKFSKHGYKKISKWLCWFLLQFGEDEIEEQLRLLLNPENGKLNDKLSNTVKSIVEIFSINSINIVDFINSLLKSKKELESALVEYDEYIFLKRILIYENDSDNTENFYKNEVDDVDNSEDVTIIGNIQ